MVTFKLNCAGVLMRVVENCMEKGTKIKMHH